MTEEKFSDKIISKIKEEKLKPRPRWEFIFKNYFLWIVGFLSLFFGALSFSLVIYLFNSSVDIFSDRFGASFWRAFLAVVPVFWLIFLALFVFLFYLNLKKTKRAYKYSPFFILIIGLISSIALGTSFYMIGFGKKLDSALGKNINPIVYGRFMNPQLDFWSEAEEGRIAGIISRLGKDKSFFLLDKNLDEWLVYYNDINSRHILNIEKGALIRCFGEKISEDQFRALRIMPMHSANNFFDKPKFRR
jgi:hypothetical protein